MGTKALLAHTKTLTILALLASLLLSTLNPLRASAEETEVGYEFTKTIGGVGPDSTRGVATDSEDNTYVASNFSGTVDFDQAVAWIIKQTLAVKAR